MKIKQITHLGRIFWFTGESWSQDEYEARELSPEQAEKKLKIFRTNNYSESEFTTV